MGDSYVAIDAYSFLGEGYNKKKLEEYQKKLNKWCYWKRAQFLYNYFTSETRSIILCLIVIGIVTGLIATFVEFSVRGLIAAKKEISAMVGEFFASQAIWVLSCVVLALCACTAPKFISSGIPEMKTIVSGVDMPQYLSGKTLVAKVIGLILAQGSELIIGRVGPFVHIGACVCNQILKLPFFKALRDNYHLKMQMIAAAASLGPAAVFGAPIGGVFFSIEVTATFFYAKNLWKGILCAGCAKVVNAYFRGVLHGGIFSPFFKTDFPERPYTQSEFFLLIFAGTLVSFVGAFFTFVVKRYVLLRGKFPRWKTSLWIQVGVVTFVVAAVQYPITLIGFGKYDSIEILLSVNELSSSGVVLTKGYEIGYLIGIFCIKFVIVVISTTLPLPAGMFAPSVLLGCYCGRMFGELFSLLFPHYVTGGAGGYALIGMAAFPCAVTGTFSPALIILEATGAIPYLPELLLVSVIGYSIGEASSGSIYNVMIKLRKLPFLSANLTPKYTGRLVQEIMETNVQYCSFKSTSADLAMLLEDAPNEQTFAIVDAKETMHLLGSVSRTQIEDMLSTWPESVKSSKPVRWVYRYQTSKHSLSHIKEFYGSEGADIKPGELLASEDVDAFDKFVQKGLERGCCGFVFNTETKKLERKKSPIEQKIDEVQITNSSASPVVELEEISISGENTVPEISLSELETNSPITEKNEVVDDIEKEPHVEFNPAPFQTFAHTPLVKVQFLFSMLTLQQAYITYNGRLVGRLSKRKLLEYTPPVK